MITGSRDAFHHQACSIQADSGLIMKTLSIARNIRRIGEVKGRLEPSSSVRGLPSDTDLQSRSLLARSLSVGRDRYVKRIRVV
jgi:hypothetical protein